MSLMLAQNPYANARSLPFRFRQKRFVHVAELIDRVLKERGCCRILDVGGEAIYWNIAREYLEGGNIHVTLANLQEEKVDGPHFTSIKGDATDLSHLADMSYDLVHSNSVIEHVGNWQAMKAMAQHVRRLAPKYFVQSPYFWFPLEPHVRLPIFHWLPEQLRYRILMGLDTGFAKRRATIDHAINDVQRMALLDKRQFAFLFPDADLRVERVLGLPKSLMAVRG